MKPSIEIRFLINEDGSPFDSSELETLAQKLDSLNDVQREEYRNGNSSLISEHTASKILIVSGPGTGKSFLFLQRIQNWLRNDSNAKIFVTSFVRKLVADLQNDIDDDLGLSNEFLNQITVSTLHKFARSLVEINHGTKQWPFKPHFQIISQQWLEIVWKDVLSFHPDLDTGEFALEKFNHQLHNDTLTKLMNGKILEKHSFNCVNITMPQDLPILL